MDTKMVDNNSQSELMVNAEEEMEILQDNWDSSSEESESSSSSYESSSCGSETHFDCIVDRYENYLNGNESVNYEWASSDGIVFLDMAEDYYDHLRLVRGWSPADLAHLRAMVDEYFGIINNIGIISNVPSESESSEVESESSEVESESSEVESESSEGLDNGRYSGEWTEYISTQAETSVEDSFQCVCQAFETYWYWQH